jgi:hypothetical protein
MARGEWRAAGRASGWAGANAFFEIVIGDQRKQSN